MLNWICGIYWVLLTAGVLRPHGGDHPTGIESVDMHSDLGHFVAFAVLGGLVAAAWREWGVRRTVLVLVGYAVVAEVAQVFVPGRAASLVDGAANVTGVLFGVAVWFGVVNRRIANKEPQNIEVDEGATGPGI